MGLDILIFLGLFTVFFGLVFGISAHLIQQVKNRVTATTISHYFELGRRIAIAKNQDTELTLKSGAVVIMDLNASTALATLQLPASPSISTTNRVGFRPTGSTKYAGRWQIGDSDPATVSLGIGWSKTSLSW